MGGLFECAANGIPIVPIPFSLSADQPLNARAAVAAGFAVRPCSSSALGGWWQKRTPGGDPIYTAGEIREAVEKAVSDSSVQAAAARMKRAVLAGAHGRVAADAVESA